VPPFTGVAVNVTDCEEHIAVLVAVMETEGVTDGLTVISSVFEVAVDGLAHAALEVTTQDIASLLAKETGEYVEELVPVLTPFFSH
jgi:hypothetical protein